MGKDSSALAASRRLLLAVMLLVAAMPLSQSAFGQNMVNAVTANEATANAVQPQPGDGVAEDQDRNDQVAEPPPIDENIYENMFKIIFAIFVLALVIESALALLFNWRPFLQWFDGRGVKSLISFAVSVLVAKWLQWDIVARLSEATTGVPEPTSTAGYILTGLILAGGSSGVNNLLRGLGFRQFDRRDEITPKPPKNEAWIAVRLKRVKAQGSVNVLMDRNGQGERLVGTIQGARRPPKLFSYFLPDRTRFPTVAGSAVAAGDIVKVVLRGTDENNQPIDEDWGPYTLEAGAIIDFDVEL